MLMINKGQAGTNANGQLGPVDTEIGFVPIAGASDVLAYTGVSAQFAGVGAAMVKGQLWWYVATSDSWIAQGATPTAAKAAGSLFVPKGAYILIDGAQGAKLAVIQDAAGGNACLQRLDG